MRVSSRTGRVRPALLIGACLLAVSVAGCARQPLAQVPGSADSSVSVEPSESLAPVEVPVPLEAFFVPPAATTQLKPEAVHGGSKPFPKLCGAAYDSDAAIRDSRDRILFYHAPGARPGIDLPEGTVDHNITVYESGGAQAAMRELRSSVGSCAEELDERTQGTLRYRLLSATARGDDSLLVEQVWVAPASMPKHLPVVTLYSAVRVGDVVTVLKVEGWEGLSADPAITDDYTELAVKAIITWLT